MQKVFKITTRPQTIKTQEQGAEKNTLKLCKTKLLRETADVAMADAPTSTEAVG